MHELVTVILAAGMGTRMKSGLVKVLHPVAGLPMLAYPVRVAMDVGSSRVIVVVGHQQAEVRKELAGDNVLFVAQTQQLGTGHAVAVTGELLTGFDGDILILCGDVPLITADTVRRLLNAHRDADADVSVLTAVLDEPAGYGRIVRSGSGGLLRIVEHRDASDTERAIREINTGIYCCGSRFLFRALQQIKTNNDQGEYYLPDIVLIGRAEGAVVQAVTIGDFQELRGVNDRSGLADAEKVMRRRIAQRHLEDGVTMLDPQSTCIDSGVVIGRDTTLYPNTVILGRTTIGSGCRIESNCVLSGASIGNNVHMRPGCVIDESRIQSGASVGPYAHLRCETDVGERCRIGNFVEVVRSRIGAASRVQHHVYLGDALVGSGVTIGAGAITCNYDGTAKRRTVIEDGAFVGSNVSLVAPVRIGRCSVVGAGSTITEDVPDGALAVARARQCICKEPARSACDNSGSPGSSEDGV
jgi:bifunctional UDP-N-acetylglucosamine pyrophosphorylase / glucosamine-1-phosphate N-acetyltransferase